MEALNLSYIIDTVIVKKTTRTPKGCSCRFVPINKYWGVKIYKYEDNRDVAYDNQKRLHKYTLTPAVGEKFTIPDYYIRHSISVHADRSAYCYVTEIAVPVTEGGISENDFEWNDERVRIMLPDIENQIETLTKELGDKGFLFYDDHYGNVGFLNGKLVCIDTE